MEATRVRDDVSGAAAGTSAVQEAWPAALADGSRLLGCDVLGVIGQGGFGIVYSGDDAASGQRVAIREYLPATMIYRDTGTTQVAVAPEQAEVFGTGLRSFLNEARLLSRFDHPSLVKVLRFGQANGTAYMLMPHYEGQSLAVALQHSDAPDEQQLRDWLDPLLDALATLHKAHCIHRDIAPGNILLTPDGPLLLDFGAPRRVTGHAVARAEAPIEMFGDVHGAKQGPWTDLYALAAVAYGAITGGAPEPALQRVKHDGLASLSSVAAGRYSAGFLASLDRAMSVYPSLRSQSAEAFWAPIDQSDVNADTTPEAAPAQVVPLSDFWTEPAALAPPPPPRGRGVPFKALLLLLAALVITTALWVNGVGRSPRSRVVPSPPKVAAPKALPAPQPVTPTAMPAAEAEAARVPAPAAMPEPHKPVSSFSLDVDEPLTAPPPAPPGAGKKANADATPSARNATPTPPAAKSTADKKCSEILQQASIEPLGSAQAAFLKRECHQ